MDQASGQATTTDVICRTAPYQQPCFSCGGWRRRGGTHRTGNSSKASYKSMHAAPVVSAPMQLTGQVFWISKVQNLSFFCLALKNSFGATPASQLVVVVARSSHDSVFSTH